MQGERPHRKYKIVQMDGKWVRTFDLDESGARALFRQLKEHFE